MSAYFVSHICNKCDQLLRSDMHRKALMITWAKIRYVIGDECDIHLLCYTKIDARTKWNFMGYHLRWVPWRLDIETEFSGREQLRCYFVRYKKIYRSDARRKVNQLSNDSMDLTAKPTKVHRTTQSTRLPRHLTNASVYISGVQWKNSHIWVHASLESLCYCLSEHCKHHILGQLHFWKHLIEYLPVMNVFGTSRTSEAIWSHWGTHGLRNVLLCVEYGWDKADSVSWLNLITIGLITSRQP